MERHRAVDVALRALRPPHDVLVRHLVGDRGLPRPVRPEDLGLPVQLLVGLLLDVLDLLHEGREVGEPGPLVVGDLDGHAHVDGLHDVGELQPTALLARAAAEGLLDLLADLRDTRAERGAHGALALGQLLRTRERCHQPSVALTGGVVGEPPGRLADLAGDHGARLLRRDTGERAQRAGQLAARSGLADLLRGVTGLVARLARGLGRALGRARCLVRGRACCPGHGSPPASAHRGAACRGACSRARACFGLAVVRGGCAVGVLGLFAAPTDRTPIALTR